jgi:hypothetical protein
MKRSLFAVPILILFLVPTLALGAIHYILDGGSGDGSAWNNAWDDLPGSFIRGDTYYIGDGTYGGHVFTDAESGTDVIYITKATEAVHGTETGWSSNMGDNAATFTGGLEFEDSYYDLDGVTGGGPTSWESGHGFRIIDGTFCKGIKIFPSPDHQVTDVNIRHVEIKGGGPDGTGCGQDLLEFAGPAFPNRHENILVEYSYVWFSGRTHMRTTNVNTVTIRYTKMFYNESTGGQHGECISHLVGHDWVIANNWFEDCDGTGMILHDEADGWDVYGNVFLTSAAYPRSGQSGELDQGSVTDQGSQDTRFYSDNRIYNNTIVDLRDPGNQDQDQMGFIYMNPAENYTGNTAYNNLCYNSKNFGMAIQTPNSNWYYLCGSHSETNVQNGSADPFTDSANHDFTLAAATNSGVTTSFTSDMLGVARGADGVWDRGAFEFQGDVLAIAISSPTSSATYATSTTPIGLGGTASYSSTISSVAWANNEASSAGTCTGTTTWTCSGLGLVSGSNTITATVTAADASTGSDLITVTYPIPDAGQIAYPGAPTGLGLGMDGY